MPPWGAEDRSAGDRHHRFAGPWKTSWIRTTVGFSREPPEALAAKWEALVVAFGDVLPFVVARCGLYKGAGFDLGVGS